MQLRADGRARETDEPLLENMNMAKRSTALAARAQFSVETSFPPGAGRQRLALWRSSPVARSWIANLPAML